MINLDITIKGKKKNNKAILLDVKVYSIGEVFLEVTFIATPNPNNSHLPILRKRYIKLTEVLDILETEIK